MIAIFLAALFAAALTGAAVVLADSAVRGRNAFRQLRGQLARLENDPRIRITLVSPLDEAPLPALRPRGVTASRVGRRPVPLRAPSLPAAA